MQTTFTLAQLADPQVAESEKILRACVHCGFCTATCPTYVLLGDELDSPRGRIYLIKEMLEHDRPATADVVKHIDRCLSCLACMTTCPSGVHYMHLVDHARGAHRAHLRAAVARPDGARRAGAHAALPGALSRRACARAARRPDRQARLRHPTAGAGAGGAIGRFRLSGRAGRVSCGAWRRMLRAGARAAAGPRPLDRRRRVPGRKAPRRARVALLLGLRPAGARARDQRGRDPSAHATRRRGRACRQAKAAAARWCITWAASTQALAQARRNIDAWMREVDGARPRRHSGHRPQAAARRSRTTASCSAPIRPTPTRPRAVSALAKDMSEYLATLDLGLAVPQSGTRGRLSRRLLAAARTEDRAREPKQLLDAAGFIVKDVPEGHLCCGSAGTYNMLQPEIATRLRDRKVANIEKTAPDVDRNRQCRLHGADRRRRPTSRSCTRSSCSIGRPAVPLPDALKSISKRAISSRSLEAVS